MTSPRRGRRGSHNPRRDTLARTAAELMLDDGVKHYFDAKRLAARRQLGNGSKQMRPRDLPSNGEIREWILKLGQAREDPETRQGRLTEMRRCALEFMTVLDAFHPRLIGSVASGHIRPGSDIDLHVFTDHPEELGAVLDAHGMNWDHATILVRRGNDFEEYLHILVEAAFPIELSVYACSQRRVRTRSSTDGRPIDRLNQARVQALIDTPSSED